MIMSWTFLEKLERVQIRKTKNINFSASGAKIAIILHYGISNPFKIAQTSNEVVLNIVPSILATM